MVPILSFDGIYSALSNSWGCSVEFGDITYGSATAAFQAQKADEYDVETRIKFSHASAVEAEWLGGTIIPREEWNNVKDDVMHSVVLAKFQQNPDALNVLMETGNARIIYGNNKHDNYWGKCLCPFCATNESGNKLGEILMRVRKELRAGKR